ncbi:death-associated inhibitor of apoptosis 2-like [Neocloeon triangulifer]|uniref:death-associated inhibitor of apoptosis 2-like n=1 Tax=Neocloeon triangulifer TaxID=2078957 RepID=UPI00286F1D22|nr:death-associated inhibitor of apoptosis 2-like [Neocloeon triangulifer]XP_059488945.1 death-associated inhibitor of apoptosis 2-like [Neocloeon triangulifer]
MPLGQAPIQKYRLQHRIELHRRFTYPSNFKKRFALDHEVFAEAGYYCQNSNGAIRLRCHFCSSEISKQEIRNFGNLDAVKNFVAGKNCPVKSDDSDNVPLNVKQLNFRFESHRLYSLLQKDDWQFVTPENLAADGFYYTGVDDNCRCQFCNLEVRGWEDGDQVRSEHQRWNAECPFLKNQNSVQNIPIGQELIKIKIWGTTFPFTTDKELLQKFGKNVILKNPKVSLVKLNIEEWSESRHPRYTTFAGRLATFLNRWPQSMTQKPEALALAGFFYTGCGDRVICFHCNLGLKDWAREDEPLEQHERWNAACQYLDMRKKEKKQVAGHKGSVLCVQCKDERVAMVNLPCGHANSCTTCSEKGERCVMCDSIVIGQVRFFP